MQIQFFESSRVGQFSQFGGRQHAMHCTLLHYLLSGPASLFADEGLSATVCWRHLWLDPCLITSLIAEHTYRTASHIWTALMSLLFELYDISYTLIFRDDVPSTTVKSSVRLMTSVIDFRLFIVNKATGRVNISSKKKRQFKMVVWETYDVHITL